MADAGRPSKYKPTYCNELLAAGDEGLSLLAFAGIIGVGRSTLNHWMEDHPEFKAACELHQAKRVLYLERTLLSSDQGPKVTSRIFALKNADPEGWKDKHDYEHSGGFNVVHVPVGKSVLDQ